MRAQAARLPAGLEERTRAALRSSDGAEAERQLMVFFAALARDLAQDALRRLGDTTTPAEARTVLGRRFLEAIWRYYNLIDFAVSQRDSKTSVAVRLAFDEAESAAKADGVALRDPLQRLAHILDALVEASTLPRRSS
jgi:hypothetical protein